MAARTNTPSSLGSATAYLSSQGYGVDEIEWVNMRYDSLGWQPDRAVSSGPVSRALTVLVVDDEQSIAQLLEQVLASTGYRVLVAHNGRNALTIARAIHPELILTDCIMPELNGIDFVHELRANTATFDIPVVLMSSTRPHAEALGATPFLAKPFDLDEVLRMVAAHAAAPSVE